jgi:hypothetical protein
MPLDKTIDLSTSVEPLHDSLSRSLLIASMINDIEYDGRIRQC